MSGILISFSEFLAFGKFGPITPDLCLLDVANEIGAPTSFITEYAENIPTYWRYGRFEIEFEQEAPHKIRFYQIEFASDLEGQFELINDSIVLLLEGFHGRSKPSEFLSQGLWDADTVTINIGAMGDDVRVNICAGVVAIIFQIDSRFIEDGDAERYVANNDASQIVRDIDHRAEINCIEVKPSAADNLVQQKSGHTRHLSGREYLGFLRHPSKASKRSHVMF